MKTYKYLFQCVGAFHRCAATGSDWRAIWEERGNDLVGDLFPSGSGFDNGTQLNWGESTADKLVFSTSFHHMNDGGMYDGWTDHTVTVRPAGEMGYHVKISGPDRREIKDYIAECFSAALDTRVTRYGRPVTVATAEMLGIVSC